MIVNAILFAALGAMITAIIALTAAHYRLVREGRELQVRLDGQTARVRALKDAAGEHLDQLRERRPVERQPIE